MSDGLAPDSIGRIAARTLAALERTGAPSSSGRPDRLVLVVEDDRSLRETLHYNLVAEGYRVLTASDGAEALSIARERRPDLVLLDLMLPGLDGLGICRALRGGGDSVPILMLTAKHTEVDRVVGLEVGADDYVTKPFSLPEVLARVRALLRRVDLIRAEGADAVLRLGGLEIRTGSRVITLDGERLELRPKEFELLAFLARHEGQAFSRQQLLQRVWGYSYSGASRTVDVHIRWLRTKIEPDPAHPRRLITVRGLGYRFDA